MKSIAQEHDVIGWFFVQQELHHKKNGCIRSIILNLIIIFPKTFQYDMNAVLFCQF